MKSSFPLFVCAAVFFGTLLGAPAPAAANPLKSIGSGLRKAGNALNPFKRAPKAEPVPNTPPPKAKPVAAKTTKPVAAKKKKSTSTATAKKSTGAAAAATATAATAAKTKDAPAGEGTKHPDEAPALPPSGETPPAAPEAAPTPPAEIPFGTPVMGRKGYVRSPYAEDQGMVDVTDIPAGSRVKCPFTGKVFRVP